MVPKDWKTLTLADIFDFKNGFNADKSQYGKGTKFVNVLDVLKNNFLTEGIIKGKVDLSPEAGELYSVVKGDVLFNRTSETQEEVGMTAVYLDDSPVVFGGFVIRARPRENILDINFCKYCFNSKYTRQEIIKKGQGAVRANIGQGDLGNVPLLIPPKIEQVKIAKILSVWDETIKKIDMLINNKNQLFNYNLSKLCNDPGGAKWQGKIGEIAVGYSGLSGKSKKDFLPAGKPFITYSNVFKNSRIDLLMMDNVVISEGENQNVVCYGDIIFTGSSETIEDVGMSSVVLDELKETYLNSFCFGIRLKNFDLMIPEYARFYFRSREMRKKISKLGQGSTRFNLSRDKLLQISIELPSIEKQLLISNSLFALESEIRIYYKLRKALSLQKEGLMQELLLGKKRVTV